MEEQNYIICNHCFVKLSITEYKVKRTGQIYKTCQNCIENQRKNYAKNKNKMKCEHDLNKYYCSVCKANRQISKPKKKPINSRSVKDLINEMDNEKQEEFLKLIITKLDEFYTSKI